MLAKAIVAVDAKKVEIRDVEIGSVGEWDIRVELETSGISVGTESYMLGRANSGWQFILGYGPIGRIVEIGEKAAEAGTFKMGDRVSYFAPRGPTGVGQSCGGHMSPAIIDVNPATRDLLGPNSYVVKVPPALPSELAAFGGISAVSCMGVSMPHPNVGDKVVVIGQGLIGQFAAQHFKLRGCEVAVADIHDSRLKLAKAVGADHVINTRGKKLPEAVREIWSNGAEIVTDTTGSYRVVEDSIGAACYRGKYVFLGWCKGTDFNLERFHGWIYEAYFPWTLEGKRVSSSWRLMETGALKIEPLITHRFSYREAQKAFDLIYRAPEEYTGILVDWRK